MEVQKIENRNFNELKENFNSFVNKIDEKNRDKRKDNILDEEDFKKLEDKINNITTSLNFEIEFQVHKSSKKYFVKIVDKNTKKVIREIPPEQLLDFYANFEKMLGLLFNRRT